MSLPLRSDNIDDVSVVPLGTTRKALAVYRDEACVRGPQGSPPVN